MIEVKTIVADPPWPFRDRLPGESRGAGKNYSTMSLDGIEMFLPWMTSTIRRLDQGILDSEPEFTIAPDARLFLWRVASQQEEALKVMRAWKFDIKSEIIWLKKTSTGKRWFGMGRQVRMEHEVCLIGTRGRPDVLSKSIRSVFEAKYTVHSGKPDEFFKLVESLSPGPYVELFARTRRDGWLQFGDELGK
jgi:hypothetical protein